MATIFIDGQAGTTGIEITTRLAARDDLTLLSLSDAQRKQASARQDRLQQADVAILCLPDDAAREAVQLAAGKTRIIDASTAYRTASDWSYGLPEMSASNRADIASSQYLSNPGCYPQGFILLTRPLIEAGLLSASTPLRCHAVSGYSGGGRQMIERFRAFTPDQQDALNSQSYSLTLSHKHVPEMHKYSGTQVMPILAPMVANYYKGMLVHVPLFRQELGDADPAQIHEILASRYAGESFIEVLPFGSTDMLDAGYLNPTACNGTNNLQLMVFGNQEQVLLAARYDNLGKGAAGAAVQNLNIMLGIDEQTGL
jgi:N-acetyl-gamma-glutamyl-phosphate reductase